MNIKHLLKIITLCLFLIIAGKCCAQTSGLVDSGQMTTFKITQGANATLHANSANAAAFQWYRNNLPISGAVSIDCIVSTAGIYNVIAFNTQGCSSPHSENVNVIILPTDSTITKPDSIQTKPDSIKTKQDTAIDLAVNIESTNVKARPGDSYNYILSAFNLSDANGTNVKVTMVIPALLKFIPNNADTSVTYKSDAKTLTWNIGKLYKNDSHQININVSVVKSGTIESKASITGNQADPILSNNTAQVVQQANSLTIPNVFTPNGDGINDTFYITGLDAYGGAEVVIMTKAGGVIYNNENYKNDWTGNNLPEGTYFYIVKVKTQTGEWEVYKGYITLLRTRV
jgi:gliding motility-associated-like protein/uncharacterized repeat protein (TIGR01451 family)